MSDPLKIMDEIEHDPVNSGFEETPSATKAQWQSLRTALERQAEELTQLKSVDNELASEGLDYFKEAGDDGDKVYVNAIRAALAQKEPRIARLQEALAKLLDLVKKWTPGLNGYWQPAEKTLNESERQSVAALKAEALREAADDWEPQPCPLNRPAIRERLREMADELERAKREGGE